MIGFNWDRFDEAVKENGFDESGLLLAVTTESASFKRTPSITLIRAWLKHESIPAQFLFPISRATGKSMEFFFDEKV